MGRAGRYDNASPTDNYYVVCGSLEEYCKLVLRHYQKQTEGDKDFSASSQLMDAGTYRREIIGDLKKFLRLIICPKSCVHFELAKAASNPMLELDNNDRNHPHMQCGDFCNYCRKELMPKVHREKLTEAIKKFFLFSCRPSPNTPKTLVTFIRDSNNAHEEIFGMNRKGRPTHAMVSHVVLALLVSDILSHVILYDEKKPYMCITMASTGSVPNIDKDSSWVGINTINS